MNKQRRKRLGDLATGIRVIMAEIETLCDEEHEALDNLPESLQLSDRAQTMETVIEHLEEAEADLDGALASVEAAAE